MSKDLQNAVNNFVVGFSLGDRVMARHDAAEAARQKWQTMLEWRKADTAEKAKRNASYDAQSKAHSDLMAAQAEWYRKRGPGGGGKISVGSTGKPAYSPADQAYIDKQVAAGYTPPAAQETTPQPTISVDMPEQPPPPIGAMPPPPDSGSSGPDPTTSMFSDAHGGMVPRVPFHATGVSGTSGPGSGYGVRAAPPSYQAGGDVKKKFQWGPWYDPLRYTLPPSRKPPPAPTSPTPATPATGTAPASSSAPASSPATEKTDEGMDPYLLPRGGSRNASGTSYPSEPDVPPQGVPTRSGGGGGRGAIDTGPWKKLGDQTRIKAYDPTLDAADRRNIGIIDANGRVNQQAYRASPMTHPEAYPAGTDQFTSGPDYSARWNNTNVFGSPPPEDRAMTWRRGGPVRRFAFGGPTGGTVENLNYASPAPQLNLAGGSANAATGSGGDSTGGASGTGGVGGSASDDAGGSAAAGVGGDDGGTYRRGGRVRRGAISTRYRAGGAVTPEYQDPPGDDDDQPTIEYHGYGTDYGTPRHARPYKPYYGPRKEEPAWIQRNDDNDYGYGDENVGPAPGREVPTMARGGRVQRYDEGGGVQKDEPPPVYTGPNQVYGAGPMAPDTSAYDAPVKLRLEYESRLPGASPEQKAAAWGDYKIRMKRLDPSIKFEDETDSNAGTERSSDEDIHPPLPTNQDRGAGSYPSEPDVPPQGRVESRPPARRGAIDTGRWKGLRDQTREKAYDPVLDRDDPDNVHMVDDTGQVNPQQGPPAPGPAGPGGPGQQAGEGAMGGYGLNPQGANAQGAGLSTNNAHNDFTPIMKAASDFAGHVFHLSANDEHTAGGYHALMAGHGAAPINMIEQGFQKLDPQGKMPVNQKIELLSQHLYDYYVSQGKPEMASKVAFEVAQFGSVMAKKQAGQAGDLLQGGDFDGAMTHLTAGYNWLVDGHTADYDPRSRMVTLRDSKSGEVTGQIPATPELVKNLTLGMASGELNWDIMRGRGSLPHPGAPPPGAQAPPGPPSRPAVQPAAAPAGPPQQPPAAPTITPQPPVMPPQGDGGPPGSPAGNGPPQGVQPAPPPSLTSGRNTVITSTPPPPGPSNRSAQPQPTPSGSQPAPTGSQPTQTKQPAQGDQTGEPEEGSEAWYEKHPNTAPNRLIRRASLDIEDPPDSPAVLNELARRRQSEINRIMTDAGHGGLSQSGKSLVPQFIAQVNSKYDKALADLKDARKDWNEKLRDLNRQESSRIQDRKEQATSTESNLEDKFETYFTNKRKGFDDMDQVAEAKRIRDMYLQTSQKDAKGNPIPGTGHTDANGERFNMVAQAPLRYMATPDDRARLKELATQIWIKNPGMSERQAAEHALNFTSIVGGAKGHNNGSGDAARTFRLVGHDTLRNVVLQNEAGEQVHLGEESLRQIENLHRANTIEFANEKGQRKRTQSEKAARGGWLPRALANNPLLGIPREAGELAAPKDAK